MNRPEIECPDCEGLGFVPPPHRMGETTDCEPCGGTGWREMTEDEANAAAADAYSDMCEGEPPFSVQEQYERAAEQKRKLG